MLHSTTPLPLGSATLRGLRAAAELAAPDDHPALAGRQGSRTGSAHACSRSSRPGCRGGARGRPPCRGPGGAPGGCAELHRGLPRQTAGLQGDPVLRGSRIRVSHACPKAGPHGSCGTGSSGRAGPWNPGRKLTWVDACKRGRDLEGFSLGVESRNWGAHRGLASWRDGTRCGRDGSGAEGGRTCRQGSPAAL